MWEYINKGPLIRSIIIIIIGLIVLGLAFNIMFGSNYSSLMYDNHYSVMPSYGLGSQSVLAILAKILLFVSGIGFIISMTVCLVKNFSIIDNSPKSECNADRLNNKVCNHCGFDMQVDWKCCPKCGDDAKKQETSAEKVNNEVSIEADKETQEKKQDIVESIEIDDVVERLYQDDKNKNKKNNQKNKKHSSN